MSASRFEEAFESHVCDALREHGEAVLAARLGIEPPTAQGFLDLGFRLHSAERRLEAVRVGPWSPAVCIARASILGSLAVAEAVAKRFDVDPLDGMIARLQDLSTREGLDALGRRYASDAADALARAQASARR